MAKSTSSVASPSSSSSSSSCSSSTTSSSSTTTSANAHLGRLKTNSSCIDRRKRLAANARERKRMHLLNSAYDRLRRRLADAENKSKYDVLVQAKEYIQALAAICEKFDKQHPEQAAQRSSCNSKQTPHLEHSPVKMQTSPVDMTYNNHINNQHLHHNHLQHLILNCSGINSQMESSLSNLIQTQSQNISINRTNKQHQVNLR